MMKTINIKQLQEVYNEENGEIFYDVFNKLIPIYRISFYNVTFFAGCICLSLEKTIDIFNLKTFKIEGLK